MTTRDASTQSSVLGAVDTPVPGIYVECPRCRSFTHFHTPRPHAVTEFECGDCRHTWASTREVENAAPMTAAEAAFIVDSPDLFPHETLDDAHAVLRRHGKQPTR